MIAYFCCMLVLLDIDGVMVPANAWKRPEFLHDDFAVFSPVAIRALQKIISETHADIILTTSHKSKFTIDEWIRIFETRGVHVNGIATLADNNENLSRKDEILRWLHSHVIDRDFIIIDDDKSLNALPDFLKSRLILTAGAIGLTDELADKAIALLRNENLMLT